MAEIAKYHPIIVATVVIIVMSPSAFSSNPSIKGVPVFIGHFFAYSCQPTALAGQRLLFHASAFVRLGAPDAISRLVPLDLASLNAG